MHTNRKEPARRGEDSGRTEGRKEWSGAMIMEKSLNFILSSRESLERLNKCDVM